MLGPIYGPPYPYVRNDDEYLQLQARREHGVTFRGGHALLAPLPNPREGTYRVQRGSVWVDFDITTGEIVARSPS